MSSSQDLEYWKHLAADWEAISKRGEPNIRGAFCAGAAMPHVIRTWQPEPQGPPKVSPVFHNCPSVGFLMNIA